MQWPFTKRVQGGLGIWRCKKTRRGGLIRGHKVFTWPLGQPCWPLGHPPQRVNPLGQPLVLQHLGQQLVLDQQALPRRLGLQALFFGSWRRQYPRPAQ